MQPGSAGLSVLCGERSGASSGYTALLTGLPTRMGLSSFCRPVLSLLPVSGGWQDCRTACEPPGQCPGTKAQEISLILHTHTHHRPSPPPRRTSYLPEPRRLCCLISLVGIGGLLLTSSCTFPLSLASAMLVPRPHPAHPSSWTTRDRMLSACPVPGPGARRWRGRKSQESVPPLEDADSA